MSTIGSTSAGTLNLAGSVVGSSRPESATDRTKAASAEQKALADRHANLSRTLGDIADAEFGTERDADGRLLYRRAARPASAPPNDVSVEGQTRPSSPAVDASGDRGNALDVQA